MLVLVCLSVLLTVAQCQTGQDKNIVAFTKGLVAHAHYTGGEIIMYNKDITNFNSQFTPDGKFQAPVDGIYSFHFYALSRSDSEVWIEFYKNEDYLISTYAYTGNDWADAGNTLILELQAGDKVYVKAVDDYDNALYGASDEIYTTFTGELLFSEKSGTANPIAFSVGFDKNVTIPAGTNVMYDKVFTNAGNGFDMNSGEYVVPAAGTYMIHYHSLSEYGMQMYLDLYVNGQYINSAYANAPNTWADAGNSAILDLNVGDRVSVKARQGETVALYGQPDEIYCTFSGVRLSAQNAPDSGANAGNIQAFSAGLTANKNSAAANSKLVWDKVYTNHGGGFDQSTGVFTAKVPGIYVFNFHALAQQDEEVWLELYHNLQYVNSLYGHAPHGWAGGSNTAALMLNAGDTVYVNMKDLNTKIYGRTDEIYTTFSGYLLAPLHGDSAIVG